MARVSRRPTTVDSNGVGGGIGGFGPTGIDLFEVDSRGDVFAQVFFGGGLVFVNTSLHLPLAELSNGRLLALLSGENGQNYIIDIFNPFLPLVEPTVLAALHL